MLRSRIDKLEYKLEINKIVKYYYKNNRYHRDKDLPANISIYGYRIWYKNGLIHRDNGKPSTIYSNGRMEWWENGNYIKDNFDEIKN